MNLTLNHLLTKTKTKQMKKIILTAALAICGIAAANAQVGGGQGYNQVNNNGILNVTVNDYLTLEPSTNWNSGNTFTYSTPAAQVAGTQGSNVVTVVASRAWKFEYSASNFERNGGAGGPGVATSIPAGNIWFVGTGNGSAGVNTTGGVLYPATSTLSNLANQSTGTTGSTFTLSYSMVPGLTNQMSGTYSSSITQIASLN